MIRINFALRKQAALACEAPSLGKSLNSLNNIDLSTLKELPIFKVFLPIVVGFLASSILDNYKSDELSKMDAQIEKVKQQSKGVQSELAQFAKYEKIKGSLEADELVIKTKLNAIQGLLSARSVPLSLVMAISNSIPKEVWLSQVKSTSLVMTLSGFTSDITQVSDFMKNLNEKNVFNAVELKDTKQIKEGLRSQLVGFELSLKRR